MVGADVVEKMGGRQRMVTLVAPVRLSDAPGSRLREQYERGGTARKEGGGWRRGRSACSTRSTVRCPRVEAPRAVRAGWYGTEGGGRVEKG